MRISDWSSTCALPIYAIGRKLALAALSVLAGAVFALVDRALRATPDVFAHAAVELVLGACALRHDLSFNLLCSHVRSFLAEEPGLSLDPHRRALRPVRPPLHQGCGANCAAALMARIAGPVKFSRGHAGRASCRERRVQA